MDGSSIIAPLATQAVTQTAAQQAQQNSADGISWWFKLLAKGTGVVGGCVAMATGVITLITVSVSCIIGGILQICVGFMAIVFEGPCCCPFLDFINEIGKFSDARPPYQKAVIYTLTSIIPILMCFSMSTIFGCGLVFVCGVLYGLMAVGKKGNRIQMAQQQQPQAMSPMEGYSNRLSTSSIP